MTLVKQTAKNEPMEITARSNPISVFSEWLEEAKKNPEIHEATAMALATSDASGRIHNRVVLCKSFDEHGFTFFTNYLSLKGRELAGHPFAGVVFFWDPMMRQVRISGRVEKTSEQESQEYWRTRPRDSQLSGFISKQSEEVASREELEKLKQKAERELDGKEVPCPGHWGGYLLIPETIEFWVGQAGRLHDRYQFEKSEQGWTFRRLYP